LKFLLDHGSSVGAKTKEGSTPLHLAAKAGYDIVATLLIQAGADVNALDNNHATPLDMAQPRVKSILMNKGAKSGSEIRR